MNEPQIEHSRVCGNYRDLCNNPLSLQCVTSFSGGNGRSRSENGAKYLSTMCVDVLKGIINTAHVLKYISWHSMIYLDTESSLDTFADVLSTRLPVRNIF